MRAIVGTEYGGPERLVLREIDRPQLEPDSVLVRVHAASVNPYDWHVMRGTPYFVRLASGLRRPKRTVPGGDVAGVVEAVGEDMTAFRVGDEVFGMCAGSFAEYVRGREKNLVPKPASLTFEQAAALPGAGITALQALRDSGGVQPGQRVLINGASGGIGTFAVQIAKSFDAHVTGVCSTRNLELVRSLGADEVIDYTSDDFTLERYDLIVDLVGNRSLRELRRATAPGGTAVLVAGPIVRPMVALVRRGLRPFVTRPRTEDLLALKDLVDAGKLMPVIDRTYAFADVPEAIAYSEAGHARGKVMIAVGGS
jgi:NADPH:quinone reductase-like Zn-dependent oxidoreductase